MEENRALLRLVDAVASVGFVSVYLSPSRERREELLKGVQLLVAHAYEQLKADDLAGRDGLSLLHEVPQK